MKNKYIFTAVLLTVILACSCLLTSLYLKREERSAAAEDELLVVTSFYPMYIAAENIIGDIEGVCLENLSEPQTGCLHDYQLTAEDMKLLSQADIFVINGGGIEGFLTEVAQEYPNLTIVDACEELTIEDDNAHAWMSLHDYQVQLQTICDGLSRADSAHAKQYQENETCYAASVRELEDEAADLKEELAGKPVIIFHEAFAYVAEEYGMRVVGDMDLDEERQISAGEVSDMLDAVNEYGVQVILAEELYGSEMGSLMEAQSPVRAVYLNPITRGDYDADSYLNGMRQNIELLREAFQ